MACMIRSAETSDFRSSNTWSKSTQKECQALERLEISSIERNELLQTVKHLGRTLWKWSGYHRRSLVETKMHCIKLLGDKLTARHFQSQVNEIDARVAVLVVFNGIR